MLLGLKSYIFVIANVIFLRTHSVYPMGSYLQKAWSLLESEEDSNSSDEESDIEYADFNDYDIQNSRNTGNDDALTSTSGKVATSNSQLKSTAGKSALTAGQTTPTNTQSTSILQIFKDGDVVLARNTKSNITQDLPREWIGPYFVMNAFDDGECLLQSADGERLLENIQNLRLYFSPRMAALQSVNEGSLDSYHDESHVQMNKACKRKLVDRSNNRAEKSAKVSENTNRPAIWIPALHLTQAEKRIIQTGQPLTAKIIDAAQVLLQLQYRTYDLDSCVQTKGSYDDMGMTQGVRIHFDKKRNHWLTSLATIKGVIVYGSGRTLSTSIKRQLLQRYGSRAINNKLCAKMIPVDLQQTSADSGLYAIAFAVESLVENGDLMKRYDPSLLRSHLVACLEALDMKSFPRDPRSDSSDAGELIAINISV